MKINRITFLGLILCIFILTSCMMPKFHTELSPVKGHSLNSYKYVCSTYNWDEYFSIFSEVGFVIINENQLKNLDSASQNQVLFFNKSWEPKDKNGLFTYKIALYNILGQEVFSMELKKSLFADEKDGIEELKQKLRPYYTGYNPKESIDASEYFINNTETIDKSNDDLKKYFDENINNLDLIEGIWTESKDYNYKLGIFKDNESNNRDFVAIIIETNNVFWRPQQVKSEFNKTAYYKVYTTKYYMGNHKVQNVTSYVNEDGLLVIKLKNSKDGSDVEGTFLKNYPANVEEKFGSTKEETENIGSGFIISESGLVVTNYHVIENKYDINVFFPSVNKTIKAKVELKDKNNDLAIIRLNDFIFSDIYSSSIPFTISKSSTVKLGQEVFTLGFPLVEVLGQSVKLSTGSINSLYGIQDDPRVFQISNPVQPGNSGGPLFNNNGELIGIVFSSLNAKFFYENADIIPQNVNFSIKSDYLLNLISMLPDESEIFNRKNKLLGKSLEIQIELLTPFILNIKAK
ncbi:MAG: serine protease [Candidatus Celaenobacter polaris]|nr:serine protease [Candidatus Celaenobacter polaris]